MLPKLFELLLAEVSPEQAALIGKIDALLPQTQCGLCGHRDGCLPYAHAIVVHGESPFLCVPGGNDTALKLAKLLKLPPKSPPASKWATDPKTQRPLAMRAVIDESACIGCTKCLPACPVDAIIGTAKHMHAVIEPLCTGCELCIAPCPVDCITLMPAQTSTQSDSLRTRYYRHLERLTERLDDAPVVSHTQSLLANLNAPKDIQEDNAKQMVKLATLRTKLKKAQKLGQTALAQSLSDEIYALQNQANS